MKKCSKCKQEKDESEFYKREDRKDRLRGWCKQCSNESACVYRNNNTEKDIERKVQWARANPKSCRESRYRYRYHITIKDYDNLLKLQNNVCAICGKPENKHRFGKIISLSVDHDHKTGKVRGLLCYNCNTILGLMHEDTTICDKLKEYILRYNDSGIAEIESVAVQPGANEEVK